MPSRTFLICLLALSVPACTGASIDQLRREIVAEIQLGVEATRSKDIDTYMTQMPPGATIVDEAGNRISREDHSRAEELGGKVWINGKRYVPNG